MFLTLFLKECKQMLRCLTYYVIVICMILFYISQMSDMDIIEKPVPGQEDYGFTYSDDENVIMNKTIGFLLLEYAQNNYSTYPVGFYKTVKLNEVEQKKMDEILTEITGIRQDEIKTSVNNYLNGGNMNNERLSVTVDESLSYDRFKELMEEVNQLLGGGSKYSENQLKSNAIVPMTYEDALKEYYDVVEKDDLSRAYARLFSDYVSIDLAILPVFIAVTRGLRDRRAKAKEVIYSRKASSLHIVLSRYLAMLVMLLIPIILISIIPTMECIYYASNQGINMDYLAYLKYIFGWLMPTLMVSLSVGVFITELTDSALAILVQGLWWFVSLFTGIAYIKGGGYGWNLIPRHNILGNYQAFHDNFQILVRNRVAYTALAVLLLMAAVYVYEMRRRGKLKFGKISFNRKN